MFAALFLLLGEATAAGGPPSGAQIDFSVDINGDSSPRTVLVTYGQPAQLRYVSNRPGTKSWQMEILATPDQRFNVPGSISVKMKIAEPEGTDWRIVQESEMVLLPGREGTLQGVGSNSPIRNISLHVTPRLIAAN